MKKFLVKTSIYFGALIVFLYSYALFCDYLFKDNQYLGNSKRYWQLSIQNNEYDYLVLGSSRAEGSIDIFLLDSILDKKGINLGLDGSGFAENFISLKLFLKNRNKIDTVFLQVDPYSLMSDTSFSNSFHSYAYLPFWDVGIEIKNVLAENTPLIKNWPFYPAFLTYFIYNTYYSPYNIIKALKKNNQFCGNGFDCKNGNKIFNSEPENQAIYSEELFVNPDKKDIHYYNKILNLANENKIKVISFMAPSLDRFSNFDSINILKNIHYVTSNSEKWSSDLFSNASHVNKLGRKLFTTEFGEFLK